MIKLIRISRKPGALWHIPKIPSEVDGDNTYIIDVLCGEQLLFDAKLPEGWSRSSEDITVKETCQKCLAINMRS